MEWKLTSAARVAAGALAAAATWACAARAGVPVRWDVETSRVQPAMFTAYRGETLELEARLFSYGRPLEGRPGAAVGLYWQTDGMGTAWWRAPATAVSNALSAVWSPSNDVGAAAYSCFIGEPGGSWRAAFRLRMLASPGAVPNELPPPVRVIDFAAVAATNAPWADAGRIAEAAAAATNHADAATNALAAQVGGDWLWFQDGFTRELGNALDGYTYDIVTPAVADAIDAFAWSIGSDTWLWDQDCFFSTFEDNLDAYTHDVVAPAVAAVSNYVDAAARAITNAPPENWQVQTAPVRYATAPVAVTLAEGATLAFTGDWPDAKPVYLRVITSGAYSVAPAVRLLGYTKWPDAGSTFQCAVWFTGTQYLLNLILVE